MLPGSLRYSGNQTVAVASTGIGQAWQAHQEKGAGFPVGLLMSALAS